MFPPNIYRRSGIAASLVLAFGLTGASYAQTVLVDPAATADNLTTFNTVHEAVLSFATTGANGSNPAPNIINLATASPITDKVVADSDPGAASQVTISGDIVIQGQGGQQAIWVGQPLSDAEQTIRNSTTAPPLPCLAWRQPVNLTVKNVTFIPGDPTMMSFFVLKSPSAAGTTSATVENCIFTANNGSNQPLTTTGQDDPDVMASGVIALGAGGDCIYAMSREEQGNFELNVINTVFASFATLDPSTSKFHTTSDCIISYMQGLNAGNFISSELNVYPGTVFANAGRGIQNPYGGNVNVKGSADKPVVFRNLTGLAGIWNYSDAATQPTACTVDHAHFYKLTLNALGEYAVRGFLNSVTNTVIADCGSDGINLQASGALPPAGEATDTLTIDHTVIHNSGSGGTPSGIYAYAAFNRNINVTNSVFTGPGKVGIAYNGSGVVNVSNTVLSRNGDNALQAQTAGSGTINLDSSVSDAAVTYENMTDPFAANFFKVQGSDVKDWSVY